MTKHESMKHLQKQESFSFSTSSKIDLFSDDEDVGVDDHNLNKLRILNQQQNDYFEISLPPPSPLIVKTKQDYEKEEEFEFCFSFNSSSNLVDFHTTPITTSNRLFNHHESPITNVVDFPTTRTTQMVNVVEKKYNHHNKTKNSINYKRIFLRASSPRCHQGLISPYVFHAPTEGQRVTMLHTFEKNQR